VGANKKTNKTCAALDATKWFMVESDLAASVPRFPGLTPFEYFDTNDAATVVDKS